MVKDVEIADIVEDTIELYILDTTLRRRLFKDKTSEEIREMIEEMSDFEEARTLRVDELPSHGHFHRQDLENGVENPDIPEGVVRSDKSSCGKV